MGGIENGDPNSGVALSRAAFAGAGLAFVVSGPVGYWISGRRWMFLAPLALVWVTFAGVMIAMAT